MANNYKIKRISSIYLIADARERAVIPFLEDSSQNYAHISKQINTGDYLICKKDGNESKILACIERKTHTDFAASFKDGRYENINKMITLRETTGCQLYFLIEGPAFPSPNRKFARIPFSNILAAITKLMIRHGIFIIQTENERHSAKRLFDMMAIFDSENLNNPQLAVSTSQDIEQETLQDSCKDSCRVSCKDSLQNSLQETLQESLQETLQESLQETLQESKQDSLQNSLQDSKQEMQDSITQEDNILTVPSILTEPILQTIDEAVVNMWANLKGISIVLGRILMKEFTIAELATQQISIDKIKSLKTATGRAINKDAKNSLIEIRNGNDEYAIKALAGLRNVTQSVAMILLESTGGFVNLCTQSIIDISAIKIPQKNRTIQFGKTRALKINQIIHYKNSL